MRRPRCATLPMIWRGTTAGSERPKRRHPSNPLQPPALTCKAYLTGLRCRRLESRSCLISFRTEATILRSRGISSPNSVARAWSSVALFLNSEGVAPISIGSTLVSGFAIPISGRETWISGHFFSDSTDSSSNSVDEVLNSGRGFAKSIRSASNSLQAI